MIKDKKKQTNNNTPQSEEKKNTYVMHDPDIGIIIQNLKQL